MWPGNSFDEKIATKLLKDESVNSNVWKKIPAWQAGEWAMTQATNTRSVHYINGQPIERGNKGVYTAKAEENDIGFERDKNNDIWHQYQSGYWTETEYDNEIAHSFIRYSAPGSAEYPDLYTDSICFTINKQKGNIIKVQQIRSWQRLICLTNGAMKTEKVHTVYDADGMPISSAWNTALMKRTKTFDESNAELAKLPGYTIYRMEMLIDFIHCLKSNGLENLIPPRETK